MASAILYLRVSTKEQLEGSSIETQEKICTEYAIKNGYEVTRIFVEKGESAKTADRTELKAMLTYITDNSTKLSAVIIYKVDRLARMSYDYASLKFLFSKYGLKLISATENLENTPVGRLIENQLAGFAQFDNEIRAERCTNGMVAAVKSGRYVWHAPVGYINKGGRGVSNITPADPEIVKKVHKVWELIDSGYSVADAHKIALNEGIKVSSSQFHRMLRNKIYMGVIEKFGLSIVGQFKPIIEADLFQRVLDRLTNPVRARYIYKVANESFPIRGLVLCHICSKPLTASWSSGNGGKFGYYRCTHCRGVNYKKDDVENAYVTLLDMLSYRKELKDALICAVEANLEHRESVNKMHAEAIEKEIIKLNAKEKQIVEKNFSNVLSDTLAKELLDENQRKISELTLQFRQTKLKLDDVLDVVKNSIAILEDIKGIWTRVDFDVKRRFQKFLFPSGITYDGREFGTNELAYCIALEWRQDASLSRMVTPMHFISNFFCLGSAN